MTTLLDGGMGQELLRRHGKPATPLWSTRILLDAPDVVTALHRDFIEAGSDVITLSGYAVTRQRLSRHALAGAFENLQQRAFECAHLARQQSHRANIRIAASLPPLVASYRHELIPSEADALASYREIVALQRDQVDLMLCETMASIGEARSAATAALESALPVWVALTVDDEASSVARLRSGEALEDAVAMLESLGVQAILLNCSTPESINRSWPTLRRSGLPIGAYANAFVSVSALGQGDTVDVLESRGDLTPTAYADAVDHWIEHGASIVGGCCETNPAHIAEIRRRLAQRM